MNLLTLREWIIKDSGRYDLATAAFADNGIDKYINAAQGWLDRQVDVTLHHGRVFRLLSAGEYFVRFQRCRVVEQVWLGTVSDGLSPLTPLTYTEFREEYPEPLANETQGEPTYYTPAWLREVNPDSADAEGYVGFMDVLEGASSYNGLLLGPPADQAYHVEVFGKFYADELSSDTDENFWTINHPSILVKATLRELEVFYRNSQGVADWERALRGELFELEKDFVEQETLHFDQMEG